jgi:hypothetical protein
VLTTTCRIELGTDPYVWKDLTDLFLAAVPSLTDRCIVPKAPECTHTHDNASSLRIVENSTTLTKDLARLDDLVAISRNILAIGDKAQELAAKARLDQAIFSLITLCVKVTARGFTSEGTKEDEDKWAWVSDKYKKLLIKCLQFINNMVAQNERRKLMLWVELFDSSSDGVLTQYSAAGAGKPAEGGPAFPLGFRLASSGESSKLPTYSVASNPFLLYFARVGTEVKNELEDQGKPHTASHVAMECKRRWENYSQADRQEWFDLYNREAPGSHSEDLKKNTKVAGGALTKIADRTRFVAQPTERPAIEPSSGPVEVDDDRGLPMPVPVAMNGVSSFKAFVGVSDENPYIPFTSEVSLAPSTQPVEASDYRTPYSASYGTAILQLGKSDLLRRLQVEPEAQKPGQNPPGKPVAGSNPASTTTNTLPAPPTTSHTVHNHVNVSDEGDSEDDEYVVPGDEWRGLLTDVPLILAPSEIEVLPMIIQSGIVPPPDPTSAGYTTKESEVTGMKNMHIVRCHILLAQDNGRNLLRELLIFVAAWDLREEELYFKIMAQVMEAILKNGLMPFSYHAFRESKDIISPAQAVIMKLLTNIFRSRQEAHMRSEKIQKMPDIVEELKQYPLRADVHMVNFLFTELRRHIIPQTCALIFLQGQIRNGIASPEDFPLNLWDMERMYEGIYQYLEFFAVLTEHDVWKKMMAEWEITSELVTLLEELDLAIPLDTAKSRGPAQKKDPPPPPPQSHANPNLDGQAVTVERPYEVSTKPQPDSSAPPVAGQRVAEPPQPETELPSPGPPDDEPSTFEWRNLKKLAVLVLCSLVWKNQTVQGQLGAPDEQGKPGRGLRALLNCCKIDDFNPYIKEHAIMTLRFALEDNIKNQTVLKGLGIGVKDSDKSANGVERRYTPDGNEIPREVLDLQGYETYIDERGQMHLKKRENIASMRRIPGMTLNREKVAKK